LDRDVRIRWIFVEVMRDVSMRAVPLKPYSEG